VIGMVINNSDESSSSDGYRGYGYYRHGRYTNRYYRRNDSSNRAVSGLADANRRPTPVVVSGRGFATLRDSGTVDGADARGPEGRVRGDE